MPLFEVLGQFNEKGENGSRANKKACFKAGFFVLFGCGSWI